MLELRPLRYFVAIVDSGSMTAASHRLHLAQPSLSRQLRQLEGELGIELFVRDRGRLRLSAAGREFVPIARDLLARADSALAAARALAAGRLDRIVIAAPPTTSTDVIAPFLASLTAVDPSPAVLEQPPDEVYRALGEGVDLAIGTSLPPGSRQHRPIAVFPIWLYVRPDDPLAQRDEIGLPELADRPLVVLPASHRPRQLLDQAAEEAGIRLCSVTEAGSAEVAQALAAAGRGYAVVSDDARFGLCGLRIRTAAGSLVVRLHASWDAEHHAAAAIEAFAGRIAAYCVERYGASVAPLDSSRGS